MTYNVEFVFIRSNDIAGVSPIVGIEEREP